MLGGLSISATGIRDATLRMYAVSHNVSVMNVDTPTPINEVISQPLSNGQGVSSYIQTRESVFGVDLVSEVAHLKMAQAGFGANVKALQASDSVLGTLINMVDTERD